MCLITSSLTLLYKSCTLISDRWHNFFRKYKNNFVTSILNEEKKKKAIALRMFKASNENFSEHNSDFYFSALMF